jgi:transposase
MDIAVLGIDLGKNSCSLVGLDGSGKVILRRRMQRNTIVALGANLSPCIVAMEACCGAHHLGRVLAAQGHTIRLMSPEYVLLARAHSNAVVVALAAKMARIVWALLRYGTTFEPRAIAV